MVMILEDVKINVKIKLSLFWVALLFFYLYNDVFSFFKPGRIEEIITGEIAGFQFTQVVLMGAAILMMIPILMVFLSLTLPAKVNRWANIILGIFHIVLLFFTVMPGSWAYYIFYMILEGVFCALIVWHAWKWPKQEIKPKSG